MPGKPPLRILQALRAKPWAITEASLRAVADVALSKDVITLDVTQEGGRSAVRGIMDRPGAVLEGTRHVELRDGIGIVRIAGPMVRYADWFSEVFGLCTYEQLATDIRRALEDGSVRALCLALDTPGGEVNGLAELADVLFQARGRKPLVAIASDCACSAGYWLAAACDEIVVSPGADIGCIGTICTIWDWTEALNQYGIREYTFVSSQTPKKHLDPKTPEGSAEIQRIIDDTAQVFLDALATYRGVSSEQMLAIASEGQVFIGAKAVPQRLADRVATTEALLAELAGRLGTPGRGGPPSRPRALQTSAQAGGPPSTHAYAEGDAVTIGVTRTIDVEAGEAAEILEVREGVTVCALQGADGADARWFLEEEIGIAAEPAPAEATPSDAPAAASGAPTAETFLALHAAADVATAAVQLVTIWPELAAALRAEGAAAENARVLEIERLCPAGLSAIAAECKADLSCTPAVAAAKYLEAQNSGRASHLDAIRSAEARMEAPVPLAPEEVASAGGTAKRIVSTYEKYRPRPRR